MDIFATLQITLAHLEETGDEPTLDIVESAWRRPAHSPHLLRLSRALTWLGDSQREAFVEEVQSVLESLEHLGAGLWDSELRSAFDEFPELQDDYSLAASLFEDLLVAGDELLQADRQPQAEQALRRFGEVLWSMEALEAKLAA